jgi:hypothetical protein
MATIAAGVPVLTCHRETILKFVDELIGGDRPLDKAAEAFADRPHCRLRRQPMWCRFRAT